MVGGNSAVHQPEVERSAERRNEFTSRPIVGIGQMTIRIASTMWMPNRLTTLVPRLDRDCAGAVRSFAPGTAVIGLTPGRGTGGC